MDLSRPDIRPLIPYGGLRVQILNGESEYRGELSSSVAPKRKKKSKNLLDLEERRPGVLPKPSRYIHLLAQKVHCWELLLGEHNHMQRHQSKLLTEISRFRR